MCTHPHTQKLPLGRTVETQEVIYLNPSASTNASRNHTHVVTSRPYFRRPNLYVPSKRRTNIVFCHVPELIEGLVKPSDRL